MKFKPAPIVITCLLAACMCLLVAACTTSAPNTSTLPGTEIKPDAPMTTSMPASTPLSVAERSVNNQPRIDLSPSHGGAGVWVVVSGSNFRQGSEVQIRLAGLNSEATQYPYATAKAAADGTVEIGFTMPGEWPNGERIELPEVVIVASTPDFLEKATATFDFDTGSAPNASRKEVRLLPSVVERQKK